MGERGVMNLMNNGFWRSVVGYGILGAWIQDIVMCIVRTQLTFSI